MAKEQENQQPDINESMFYDKYYVVKKSKAQPLAQEALRQLYAEGKFNEHGVIDVVDILERVCELQGAQYFAMNLDEDSSIRAMQTYYRVKYGEPAAKACLKYILKGDVGKNVVFKGKCLMTGKVIDVWRHPDGGKVYEVRDNQGIIHTVPEHWIVKWLEE
jgi:hypothetical protein